MSPILRHLFGHSAAQPPVKGHRSVPASGIIRLASLSATDGLAAFGLVVRLYPAG